jgi:hypothetical protein
MTHTTVCRRGWLGVIPSLIMAGCLGGDDDVRSAVEEFDQELVIDYNGSSIPVPLESMEVWLTEDRSTPERFEIQGDGIAIVGTFPRDIRVDYDENWHLLIGRSIPLSGRGGDPRYEKPAVLTMPGVGQFRVLGGSFTVERIRPGRNGETPLIGRIELRVRAATGETLLNGTFGVKAMTWG